VVWIWEGNLGEILQTAIVCANTPRVLQSMGLNTGRPASLQPRRFAIVAFFEKIIYFCSNVKSLENEYKSGLKICFLFFKD
jgi:hypothetical protein